jgi:hypothetical protein
MLKNYTSGVPVDRSVAMIEHLLVTHGARQVMKQYDPSGHLTGICWLLSVNGHNDVPFKLPARLAHCERVLLDNLGPRARQNKDAVKKTREQAGRTAWKIVFDWVEAQMAMIDLAQVDAMEVFLPYIYDPGKQVTYYESMKLSGFKALLGSGNEVDSRTGDAKKHEEERA